MDWQRAGRCGSANRCRSEALLEIHLERMNARRRSGTKAEMGRVARERRLERVPAKKFPRLFAASDCIPIPVFSAAGRSAAKPHLDNNLMLHTFSSQSSR